MKLLIGAAVLLVVIGIVWYFWRQRQHNKYLENLEWSDLRRTSGSAFFTPEDPYAAPLVNIDEEDCESNCANDYNCAGYSYNDPGSDATSYCMRWPVDAVDFKTFPSNEWTTRLKQN